MTEKPVVQLYTCARSRGLRCTWTVMEAGIAPLVDLRMLPFPPRAHDKSYFAVNTLGTVPALVDGDVVMTESSAICHYLAARYGPASLSVAADEADFGPFLDYLHHADATLTFPQTVALRFCVFEQARGLAEAGEAYGKWFGKRLAKIDARLADRAYLCAGRFTVADIAIAYALYLTRVTRLEHHLTPRLKEWLAGMMARPGFAAAAAWEDVVAAEQGVPNRIGG